MHRFTCNGPFVQGASVALEAVQSHHLAKVLRLQPGEKVGLVDGKGCLAHATLQEIHPKSSVAKIEKIIIVEASSKIVLCFGIPKGQALDFIYRRATELGVAGFQPLKTQHSSPAKGWNEDRWVGVLSEVCKQCEELNFPRNGSPLNLENWLSQRNPNRLLIVCDENARQAAPPLNDTKAFEGVDLVVGAEGGLSPAEVEALLRAGGTRLGLGRNRLRAETAALVALTLLKKQLGEI